eukprot:g16215.t1
MELANKNYQAKRDATLQPAKNEYRLDMQQRGWQVVSVGGEEYALLAHSQAKNLVVLAFAGSSSQADWETNLHCRGTYSPRFGGHVHPGYLQRYEGLRKCVLNLFAPLVVERVINEDTRIFCVAASGWAATILALKRCLGKKAAEDGADNHAAALDLLEQLEDITWVEELELYRPLGRLCVQTVSGGMMMGTTSTRGANLNFSHYAEAATGARRDAAKPKPGGGAEEEKSGEGGLLGDREDQDELQFESEEAGQDLLPEQELFVWQTFCDALVDCGLGAHLGGRPTDREFIRWITEVPATSLLQRGERLQEVWKRKVDDKMKMHTIAGAAPEDHLWQGIQRCCLPMVRSPSHGQPPDRRRCWQIPSISQRLMPKSMAGACGQKMLALGSHNNIARPV